VSSSTSTISAVAGNNNNNNNNNNGNQNYQSNSITNNNNSNFKSTFLTSSMNSSINNNSNNNNSIGSSSSKKHHHQQPVNHFKIMPSLRIKTNELFYRYLSDKDRTDQIKEIIAFIKQNNLIPKITDLQSFSKVNRLFFYFLVDCSYLFLIE